MQVRVCVQDPVWKLKNSEFHNLKGYDGSFIIKKLHNVYADGHPIPPKIIAKTATGLMGLQQNFLFFGTIKENGKRVPI